MSQTRVFLVSALLGINVASCAALERGSRAPGSTASNPSSSEFQGSPSGDAQEKSIFTQKTVSSAVNTADYHYAMAQAYSAEGLIDQAIEQLKLTLIYDSQSALVHSRLAGEYVKKGLLPEALEEAKEAVKIDPNYIDARLMYAGLLSAVKENQGAIREYNEILKRDPKNSEAAVYRAQVMIEEGRVKEAASTLEAFVKKEKDAALAWYFLGRSYQKQSQWKKAEFALKKSLDLRPGFIQATLALGIMLEETGSLAGAEAAYRASYEETQESTIGQRLASLLLKKENYKEAMPILEALFAADPDDLNVAVKLGLIQMELKQFSKSEAIFLGIIKRAPEADRVRFYLANLYEEMDRKDEAVKQFLQIPKESSFYVDGLLHSAAIYQSKGSTDTAIQIVKKGIEADSKQAKLYLYLGGLYEELNRMKEAVSILEQGRSVLPEEERILYYLGTLKEKTGDAEGAIQSMLALLKVNPENVDGLNFLGYLWTVRGERLAEAEQYLRKAIKIKPDSAYILDSWGWHLFVRGKTAEAIVQLEKAWKLKPEEATILEHLAEACWKHGLVRKAHHLYSEALKHASNEESRNRFTEKIKQLQTEYGIGRSVASE